MENMNSRAWIVTRHFEDLATATALRLETDWINEKVDYVVFQLEETPTTQRLHWQMYIHCTRPVRRNAIRSMFPSLGAYIPQPANGTPEQNKIYCTKIETRVERPWEFGVLPKRGKKETTAAVVEWYALNPNATVDDIVGEFPVFAFHNYSKIEDMVCRSKKHKVDFSDFVLYPWQKAVVQEVSGEADDRHIVWVTDTVGKAGKSKLAKYLAQTMGAVQLGGKLADMALVYKNNQAPIVVFDVARAESRLVDHIYGFAEKLKNGELQSGKYQSVSMQVKPPHVIIMSNISWDRARFSVDRVVEYNLQTWVEAPVAPPPTEVDEVGVDFDPAMLDALLEDLMENPLPPDNIW